MKWLFVLLLSIACAQAENAPLLRVEEAFQPSLQQIDPQTLQLNVRVAPGYYLYRDRLAFQGLPASVLLLPSLPAAEAKSEPDGTVSIYPHDVQIQLKSNQALPDDFTLQLRLQGCADGRACYPPYQVSLRPGDRRSTLANSALAGLLPAPTAPSVADAVPPPLPVMASSPAPAAESVAREFGGPIWLTLWFFFLVGLGLAFTACMYPLIPIVSTIIVGHSHRGRATLLCLVYGQGLALAYALAGIIVAMTGTWLAVVLQQPIVIGALALFFVIMALAMFGVFNLQLPSRWLERVTAWSGRLPGGHVSTVFLMGALSALLVGPCNFAPLAAALAYIGQTGNLVLGAAALYAMGVGLSLPLLVLGVFGQGVLPRLRGWVMQGVKLALGVVLLGAAVWTARPLWSPLLFPAPVAQVQIVQSKAGLADALRAAKGRAAVLDFYADWCVSCREMDTVLETPQVKQALGARPLIRVDLSDNTPEQRELLANYGLFAPPALVAIDAQGQTKQPHLVGLQSADDVVTWLRNGGN